MEHTFRLKLQEHSKNIRLKDLLVESSFDGIPDNVKENGGSLYKDGIYIGPSLAELDNEDF